ncbi:hypothetical protein DINM_001867 [Dirofilaria immitis]|nr:hypothetical protein [Dirofilaria immitis]
MIVVVVTIVDDDDDDDDNDDDNNDDDDDDDDGDDDDDDNDDDDDVSSGQMDTFWDNTQTDSFSMGAVARTTDEIDTFGSCVYCSLDVGNSINFAILLVASSFEWVE